jgi:hypothetical protein
MIENTILKRNRQGFKARAFSLTFPCRELVELAAASGFDAINLDTPSYRANANPVARRRAPGRTRRASTPGHRPARCSWRFWPIVGGAPH